MATIFVSIELQLDFDLTWCWAGFGGGGGGRVWLFGPELNVGEHQRQRKLVLERPNTLDLRELLFLPRCLQSHKELAETVSFTNS